MPRIRPLRILSLFYLCFLALYFLWVFLPSPGLPRRFRNSYIQHELAAGQTVVTAVDYTQFLQDPWSPRLPTECAKCSHVLFHWRLQDVQNDGFIELHMDLSNDTKTAVKINLPRILADAHLWNRVGEWRPCIGNRGAIDLFNVPAGDIGTPLTMPWFHTTDQVLFNHGMYGEVVALTLLPICPNSRTIELWSRPAFHRARLQRDPEMWWLDNMNIGPIYRDVKAESEDPDQEARVVASFKIIDTKRRGQRIQIAPQELQGELPSLTYPTRQTILSVIGPSLSLIFKVIESVYAALDNFMGPWLPLLWVALWFVNMYWLWGYLKRKISNANAEDRGVWGPVGPVYKTELDVEKNTELEQQKKAMG